jgi:hypothetical protein
MVVQLTENRLTAESILAGVEAVTISQLPAIWQQIAAGEVQVGHPDKEFLVASARLFASKAPEAKIFGAVVSTEATVLQSIYSRKVGETLEFYGNDWLVSAYPNWDTVLETATLAKTEAKRVVGFAQAVFTEFGYEFPASFYGMLLHPVERNTLEERRPMAFDVRMVGVARQFDASLHALNVTKVALRVQHIASKHGLQLHHGCGCENHLTDLTLNGGLVEFDFADANERQKAITAFVWRIWNEFMLFQFSAQSSTLAL